MRQALIVEDDPDVGGFISTVLDAAGYDTRIVSNGVRALLEIGGTDFELVVLDLCLPGMDGIEILQTLRGSRCSARIIAITGLDSSILATAFHLGASCILHKPFTENDLLAVVTALN
jgi:DNA-binding response OmpR family regulator